MINSFTKKEIFNIMNITLTQLMIAGILAGTGFAKPALSQELLKERVTLTLKEGSLKSFLRNLEKQADVVFSYQKDVISAGDRLSHEFRNETLDEVLKQVLIPRRIQYKVIKNNQIILSRIASEESEPGTSRREDGMNTGEPLAADKPTDKTITGRVTDEKGEALPGVNILLKGTQQGTISDSEGEFNLRVPDEGTILVLSFVGYESQETAIGSRTDLGTIVLKVNEKALEEVVVVGYGTQRKSDVTGAVGSLKLDQEINSRPVVEVGQALYGKIPGVQVLTGNGRPGASTTVQIRGINSVSASSAPLIVIDGMPILNYDLNLLNPGDVESIEILKDASSSAIYGSRGANGVVLITTRSGKEGKTKFSLNYSYGIQKEIDRIKVMNSQEYALASKDAAQIGWIESGGDPNAPNTIAARRNYKYTWPAAFDNPDNLASTDWQDVIFRNAPMQRIELNAVGGNSKSTFMVSGAYVKQDGIVITSDYKKYTFNVKAESRVNDWLKAGGMINVSYDHENEPFNRIVEWAVQYPTIYPVYGANGYLGGPDNTPGFENYNAILFRPVNGHPLYRINDVIQHKNFNSLGNVFLQADILKGLAFRSSLNFFYNRKDNSNYQSVDHNLGPSFYTEGIMTVDQASSLNYTSQNLLTYDKTWRNHSFSAMAGMEYNNSRYDFTNQERRGYDNDLLVALSAGRTVFKAEDQKTTSILISYFSRLNYSFRGKYLLSASLRQDGSSRFGPNKKWGLFPSVSGGWVVSDEAFLKEVAPVSNLKVRASYGFTGNDRFADYKWIGAMSQGRIAFGNTLSTTYYPGSITNPDLEWERTRQFNIGLELGLFGNRVLFEADYYISKSDGLLLDVPVPAVSGFNTVFQNIGKLQNKGLELNLTTHNLRGQFNWNSQFNFSLNRNKVLSLGRDNAPMIYQPGFGMESINKVGSPIFSFFGYQYDGVYMNQSEVDGDPARYPGAKPGDGRYKDTNGDGVLNANDRTIIGNYTPDFIWGVTNNFSWKNIDFSFLVQGVQGSDVYDNNIHRSMLYHEGRNYYHAVNNRWRSEQDPGDGHQYKLTVDLDGYEKTASSYWIVDGSYFRLKSITAGYTFRAELLNKLKIDRLRVYFNGMNLLTHKNAPVFDPENFNGNTTNATLRGVTHSPYPSAKTFTVGLNIGF